MDPDPNGSALIFFPESESGNKREKLKNNNIKSNDIAVNNYNFNKTNKVNLDQLHGFFFTFEQSFKFIFQLQQALHKVIFYSAGSGCALRKQLDPDHH